MRVSLSFGWVSDGEPRYRLACIHQPYPGQGVDKVDEWMYGFRDSEKLENTQILYLCIVILSNRLSVPDLVGFETTGRIPQCARTSERE